MVDVMDKIVNLEFDNKDFEKNAQTSLSTLDKLKKALNFDGAASGLEKVRDSVKNISLDGLSNAVDTVAERFSTMGVIATTALVNITNRAVDAGIKLVKSLTLDNVVSGFQEYEDSLKSVNRIRSALPDMSMEDIQEQIAKLDWYADETSYDFQGMVQAVSSFVAQDIPLEKSAAMIQGVANMAGLAGVEAKSATHAFEGFAKAVGAQYMSQQNWAWIKTAGLETAATKRQLIEAGLAVGTLYKDSKGVVRVSKALAKNTKGLKSDVVDVANFTNTLSTKWLSSEVMSRAFEEMSKYSDLVKEFQTLWEDTYDEYLSASEVMEVLGDTSKMSKDELDTFTKAVSNLKGEAQTTEQAVHYLTEEIDQNAIAGFKAAQEYRTFADAIDATKVAVSTAWSKIFQAIFGDAEQAKITWTRLGNWLWDEFASPFVDFADVVGKWSKSGGREDLIEGLANIGNAYSTLKQTLSDTFEDFLRPLKTFTVHTKELVTVIDPLTGEADRVWKLVNKTVTETQKVSNFKPFTGGLKKHLELETELVDVYDENWTIYDGIEKKITSLTTKLRKYTDTLFVYNEETGETEPSEKFAEVLGKLSRIFNGALNGIGLFADAIKVIIDAVHGLFSDEMSDMGTQVIDVAADFGDWITNLRKDGKVIDSFKEKVDKVANALRPIANFLGTIIPGAVQKFKDSNLLGALEYVFDEALGAFDKTLKNGGILTVLGDSIGSLGETLSKWSGIDITWLTSFLSEDLKQIDEFLPNLQPLLDFIKSLGETFSDNFSSTGGGLAGLLSGVFNAISDGLQAVADTGLLSSIGEGIKEFGEHLKEVTGIDLTWFTDFADKALSKIEEKIPALQPLLDFFANLGKNFKETSDANGGGLKGGIAATFDSITSGLTALSDTFTGLTGVDFSNAVGVVNDILTGFGGILSFVAGAVTDLWNGLKSLIDWFKTTDFSGFTSIFEGIGPLLTDLWEFIKTVLNDVITSLSTNGNAIGPMALLQNILIFFTALGGIKIMGILSNVKEIFGTVNDILSGFSTSTTSNFEVMAKGILMLAGAIVLLSTVDSNKFTEIGIALVGLIAMVEFAIAGLGKIAESFMAPKAISTGKKSFLDKILGHFLPEDTTGIKNMANSVLKIAGALLILATAVKILSSIEKNFGAALGAMTLMLGEIVGVMYLMALIGKKKGQLVSGASGIVAISVAMLILSSAIKKLAEIGDIPSVFASAFIIGVLTAALVGLVNSMSDSARSAIAAFAMIEIATALLILTGVLAIVANLQEQHDMFNVLLNTAGALLILAGGLMVISQIPSAKVIAAAAAMLIMSIALLALMPALLVMDNLKDPNTTLITMAEALIALAGALVIMSLVPAPGLLAASAAMVIMAAAMLILSVAVNLFGTPNAVTAIENLVSMLGIIIVLGIEGLVASAGIVILAGAIALLGVSIVVLGAGLAIIASVSDALIQLALTVYTVVKSLKTSEFGKHLLDGLFGGISLTDIWNKVKSIGQSIVNKFKEFFGIHSPSLLMEQEIGEELMPGIANGIENTSFLVDGAIDDWGGDALTLFESWMSEMGDTGETVMPDIAGYFDAGSYDVFSSIDGFGTDALGDMNGWMDLLGGSGDDVMSNLANGIDMKSYLLNDSINGMGDSAVGTMSSTLSRLSDAVNEDLVTEPVITPVLDLSKVKEGVATINELFGKVQLDKLNKFSGSSSSNKSSNVTYVQNNYSPKALSRTEIYRQTKVLVKG